MIILACLLRLLILSSFWWTIASSLLIALFNSSLSSVGSKFSSIWFLPKERIIMTSILVFCSVTSGGLGSFISPQFVHPGLPIEEGQKEVFSLVLFEAFLVGGIMLMNLLFFRADPSSCNPFSLKIRSVVDLYAE